MTAPADHSPSLALEASGAQGSVALLVDGVVVESATFPLGRGRGDALTPAIASLLERARLGARDVAAVVLGAGPGSFTSLRIAAATAKGFVSGRAVPLFAVPSPWLALGEPERPPVDGAYVVVQDALRGDVFVTPVRVADGRVAGAGPTERRPAAALGGVAGDRPVIDLREAPARVDARHLPWVASLGEPVDPASWEPDYGRAAEAQVQWEAAHGRSLPDA